jgi:hypothetical protein
VGGDATGASGVVKSLKKYLEIDRSGRANEYRIGVKMKPIEARPTNADRCQNEFYQASRMLETYDELDMPEKSQPKEQRR